MSTLPQLQQLHRQHTEQETGADVQQAAQHPVGAPLFRQQRFEQRRVAFDAPLQGSGTIRAVDAGFIARSTQLFGAFLGEPRTWGLTLRGQWGPK